MTTSRHHSLDTVHYSRPPGRTRSLAVLVFAAMLAACGSDANVTSITPPTSVTSITATRQEPASAGTPSTLGGPVSVQPINTSGVPTGDAARIAVVGSVLSGALGAGITLDSACVADVVARLSDQDLALLAANLQNHSGPPPTLSSEGEALANELDACAQASGDSLPAGDGATTENICAGVDAAALAPLNGSLGAGTAGVVVGPYGTGNACEFTGDAGSRVTVTLTRGADLNSWEDEITDGDGLGDGSLQRGIGQLAAVGVGFADAVVGADLIEVSVFPTFDVPSANLVQALSDVVDAFPF